MDIDVRVSPQEDHRRWFEVCNTAFSGELREEEVEVDLQIVPHDRLLGAYADGALVGTAADFPFPLTIPGGELLAAGVTGVGVLPSHRRRGVLTRMMERQLADARSRDEPLAILWASEASIYGRYGYGVATRVAGVDADRDRMTFTAAPDPAVTVHLIDEEEAGRAFPPIYDRVRRETPGMIGRTEDWWKHYRLADPEWRRRGAGPKFHALLELDGAAEGYASYRVKQDWDEGFARSELRVIEPMATSARAHRELWRFLFGIDLVGRVQAWPLPPDHPLFLLAVEPKRLRMKVGDGLWLRILDLERALSARSYAAEGELTFELVDPLVPENEGVWRLEATETGAAVEPGADAELRLDAGALASAYLGGFSFAELQGAERLDELAPGAVARADALFRTPRAPWCAEVF
ncbi:MAG TPA: GNAT family N-acetyltransferase [Gaiellaceae bacterium]|jgi:predicted acetyltransferase|nr:GNAT family N-acetyltransferase [Gaiellaceae bacterium]